MPLPVSGAISINAINVEFGRAGTTQTSMSQLYRGGGIVTSNNTSVPTSGQISFSQFYGASNEFSFTIGSSQTNANLRTLAINAGWNQSARLVATINSGIYCSSSSTGVPGLTVSGSFPGGVELTNNGFIIGMGGNGGMGATNPSIGSVSNAAPGSGGGLALSVSSALTLRNNGTIGGGGGGGGGGAGRRSNDDAGDQRNASGGGGGGGRSSLAANSAGGARGAVGAGNGGAGTVSGAGGGGAGASLNGVLGGAGGGGGGWGSAGSAGLNGSGGSSGTIRGTLGAAGAAGAAISGNGNISYLATGTRLGPIT